MKTHSTRYNHRMTSNKRRAAARKDLRHKHRRAQRRSRNGVHPKNASLRAARPSEGKPQDGDDLASLLTKLENEVQVADEWGIFNKGKIGLNKRRSDGEIYDLLGEARKALDHRKPENMEIAILRGREALNHAESTNWIWALNNQFGVLPLFLTGLSALMTYVLVFQTWLKLEGVDVLHHASLAGMVGAVFRSLYWLQYQTNRGLLRPRWFTTFIVAPPIGAVLGWLVSLIVSVVAQAVSKSGADTDWRTISLFAVFAGFNWEWALAWLERIVKSVQNRMERKTSSEKTETESTSHKKESAKMISKS